MGCFGSVPSPLVLPLRLPPHCRCWRDSNALSRIGKREIEWLKEALRLSFPVSEQQRCLAPSPTYLLELQDAGAHMVGEDVGGAYVVLLGSPAHAVSSHELPTAFLIRLARAEVERRLSALATQGLAYVP